MGIVPDVQGLGTLVRPQSIDRTLEYVNSRMNAGADFGFVAASESLDQTKPLWRHRKYGGFLAILRAPFFPATRAERAKPKRSQDEHPKQSASARS